MIVGVVDQQVKDQGAEEFLQVGHRSQAEAADRAGKMEMIAGARRVRYIDQGAVIKALRAKRGDGVMAWIRHCSKNIHCRQAHRVSHS